MMTGKTPGPSDKSAEKEVRKHFEAGYTKHRIKCKADLAYLFHASAGATGLKKLFTDFEVTVAIR